MKSKYVLVYILVFMLMSCDRQSQDLKQKEMDLFITQLMRKMTLDEKIGQLNLPAAGDVVTGQAESSDIARKINPFSRYVLISL